MNEQASKQASYYNTFLRRKEEQNQSAFGPFSPIEEHNSGRRWSIPVLSFSRGDAEQGSVLCVVWLSRWFQACL